MRIALFTSALMAGLIASTSVFATTLYSNSGLFNASLAASITDNYENPGYSFLQNDWQMSHVLSETKYTTTGYSNTDIVGSYDGVNNIFCGGCNGSFSLNFATTSLSQHGGVFGVGFDYFNQFAPFYNAFVTYGDGSTENFSLSQLYAPSLTFWGITSDKLIHSIDFGLVNGEFTTQGSFGIDNLTVGSLTPVSEPGSLLLVGLGLIGVNFARKKKAI